LVDHVEARHLACLLPVVLRWVLDLLVPLGRSDLSAHLEVDPAGRSVGLVAALLESVAVRPLVDFMGRHRDVLVVLADHLDDPPSEAQCASAASAFNVSPAGPAFAISMDLVSKRMG
jgi:hypothetical protein